MLTFLILEALDVIKEEHTMPAQKKRNKREVPFSHDEKRIAGVSYKHDTYLETLNKVR